MKTYHDLTLYNKYASSGDEAYQRTQIQGVHWENRKGSNVIASGGNIAADQVAVFIPFVRGDNYLDSKAWLSLVSKVGKWTLKVGDYLVKGLVADEIIGAFTISSLKAKYDDVLQITTVDFADYGTARSQHWKLGGK